MVQLICLNCNNNFILPQWRLNQKLRKFCSHKCSGEYRHKQKKVIILCLQCNKEIRTIKYRIEQGKKFCSKKCRAKHYSKLNNNFINGWKYNKEKILKKLNIQIIQKIGNKNYEKESEELGYIIGVYLGDGYIDKAQSHFELLCKSYGFIESFKKAIITQFNIPYYENRKKSYYIIGFSNKYLCRLIKSYTYKKLKENSLDFDRGFIRGFYDSEGSVGKYNRVIKINVCNTNELLLKTLKTKLLKFNIKSGNMQVNMNREKSHYKPIYSFNIYGFYNIKNFLLKIGFSENITVNRGKYIGITKNQVIVNILNTRKIDVNKDLYYKIKYFLDRGFSKIGIAQCLGIRRNYLYYILNKQGWKEG